jgi:hypothetical protein
MHENPTLWVLRACVACAPPTPALLQLPAALVARGGPVYCHTCTHRVCARCNVAWSAPLGGVNAARSHDGLSCAQADALRAADAAQRAQRDRLPSDAALARLGIKKCPSCGMGVEKDDGCDHMTCRTRGGCGGQFCWECLAEYTPIFEHGNHMHQLSCKHWRPPH